MQQWAYYRKAQGRLSVYDSVAEATGSHSTAVFLAVNADCAIGANGSFVRHTRTGHPLWSDVFHESATVIQRNIEFVYDEFPEPLTPLDTIRHYAFRNGPHNTVYHFYHPEILAAYSRLAYPEAKAGSAIFAGRFWWEGPVEALKSNLLQTLRAAGVLGHLPDHRVYACLDLVLQEQFRDCTSGAAPNLPDMTGNLKAYIARRYQPTELTGGRYRWLDYDAFWSAMRTITGLSILRPSAKTNEKLAYKLAAEVSAVMKKLAALGIDDETYFRAYLADCTFRQCPPTLEMILHPPEHMFLN